MKNFRKSLVAIILLITLILSTFVPSSAAGQPAKYSKQYNSGERDVVCTTLDGTSALSYYTGNYTYDTLVNLSSTALLQSLRTLMTNTHSYIASYDDCHYKANRTDCENEDGRVSLIYTSYSATMNQWNGWNREHVWPKSLGGGNTSGGGADLHHIRPSDAGVNSSRGNKPYGEAGSGATSKYGSDPAVGVLGGTYNSQYFEPLDNVKGDVARIVLYVYVRWGSKWGADSVREVFQSVDLLLEWHTLDPVDTWEMGRNEVVQDIQGNRNVFIDYPELAFLLFGEEIPSDMTTPSGEAKNGSAGGTTPENPPVNPPAGDICNHEYSAVCDITCDLCGEERETVGHTYTNDCDKTCSVCGYEREVKGHVFSAYCDADCNNCGAKREAAHLYIGWEVIEEPTATKYGKERGHCLYCEIVGERRLPKLDAPSGGTDTPPEGGDNPSDNPSGNPSDNPSEECEHSFGEWETDENGERSHTCTECGYTELDQSGEEELSGIEAFFKAIGDFFRDLFEKIASIFK